MSAQHSFALPVLILFPKGLFNHFIPPFFSCWTCLEVCCSFYFSIHSWYKIYLQNQSWFLQDKMFFKIVLLLRICFWTRLLCLLTIWVCPVCFCIFYVSHSFYWMTSSSLNPPLVSFTSNQVSLSSVLKGLAPSILTVLFFNTLPFIPHLSSPNFMYLNILPLFCFQVFGFTL